MSSHDLSTGDEEPRRAAERSDAVVQTLVENHRAFLRFLERRVGSRETAEDILQEAFGRAVHHADSLEDAESAVAWFYRLLRNAVIDHYRRSATAAAALERFAGEVEPSAPPPDVRDEICACVARLASSLKPEYAAALAEVEVQGMPIKAFAEAHGLTANNASVRLFRAREALRRQVVAACGTCAEHGCVDCRCGRPRRN
jgi:RNA polymerase sigma factor (sigma-70 family)